MANIYEQLDFSVPMEPIIRMCTSDIQTSIEQETLKACYRIGIEVDKERLMQALTDARRFYDEGYRAGYMSEKTKAEWILHHDGSGTCSRCHRRQVAVWDDDHAQNFCGFCGAGMEVTPDA